MNIMFNCHRIPLQQTGIVIFNVEGWNIVLTAPTVTLEILEVPDNTPVELITEVTPELLATLAAAPYTEFVVVIETTLCCVELDQTPLNLVLCSKERLMSDYKLDYDNLKAGLHRGEAIERI
jgi:hypothetical protein